MQNASRSKAQFLAEHIRASIANDHQPKTNAVDYPGYWLIMASEYLEPKNYERLLAKLQLSSFDVRTYKFLFTLDVYSLLEQEDKSA